MKVRMMAAALALAACCAAWCSQASARSAPAAPAKPAVHYYLALGDSLSVGYQPNGTGVGVETDRGYVNDLYAVARAHIANLKLIQFGCPGDTTTSMLTGTGNSQSAKHFNCVRTGGSQLAAAVAFLKAHHAANEVSLLTVDIGANDVDGCGSGSIADVATCITAGTKSISGNLPKILSALKKAAPRGTRLAGMNLYDPLLADELSSDANQQALGQLSAGVLRTDINPVITKADAANGFHTADVADAFKTYDTAAVSTAGTAWAPSTLPTDVAEICNLTWMCAVAPVGPNIHANDLGYTRIAGAFEAVLPKQF